MPVDMWKYCLQPPEYCLSSQQYKSSCTMLYPKLFISFVSDYFKRTLRAVLADFQASFDSTATRWSATSGGPFSFSFSVAVVPSNGAKPMEKRAVWARPGPVLFEGCGKRRKLNFESKAMNFIMREEWLICWLTPDTPFLASSSLCSFVERSITPQVLNDRCEQILNTVTRGRKKRLKSFLSSLMKVY